MLLSPRGLRELQGRQEPRELGDTERMQFKLWFSLFELISGLPSLAVPSDECRIVPILSFQIRSLPTSASLYQLPVLSSRRVSSTSQDCFGCLVAVNSTSACGEHPRERPRRSLCKRLRRKSARNADTNLAKSLEADQPPMHIYIPAFFCFLE